MQERKEKDSIRKIEKLKDSILKSEKKKLELDTKKEKGVLAKPLLQKDTLPQ